MEIFDAHDALGEAIWNLNMQIQDANALISNDELPSIKGDKTQLVVVFQNLIGNAIKFKNPDVPPRVHISAQKAEGRLGFCTFSIKDNGIGIEEKYFEKLFVIFQRLHGKREYPGTGIGLALVKRIIERHGGKIWL
jgi:light-regulated signal transduction histidine kinase (bacteriophytochrome)